MLWRFPPALVPARVARYHYASHRSLGSMPQPAEQIRFCTSRDGTRIAYAVSGTGPPLLWAGHWIRHLKLDWETPVWRPWLSLLTRNHTVIRYDWRGFGLSDQNGVEFSLERHVEDCEAVVAAAGLKSFVLFGLSSGTSMGLAYAVRHPERVDKLVLFGCQTCGRLIRGMTARETEEAETRLKLVELGWSNETPAYGQFFTVMHMPDANPDQTRSYNELLRRISSPSNVINLVRALWAIDAREVVPRVLCPTLVLHSRQDAIIPFEEGRQVASLISGAQFVPLESRNHILLDTEPAWQQLVGALDDFLPVAAAPPAAPGPAKAAFLDALTTRERDVLELVAQGLDNDTIGSRLGISTKTVRNQVSIIFSKLGVSSRARAIVRAREAAFGYRTAVPAG